MDLTQRGIIPLHWGEFVVNYLSLLWVRVFSTVQRVSFGAASHLPLSHWPQ